jgi:secreted trypsin-like serine protease
MVWCFERDAESLRLHTSFDNDTYELVVTVHWSDGREHATRFTNLRTFGDWIKAVMATLEQEHWIRRGSPIVLPCGWPNSRLM